MEKNKGERTMLSILNKLSKFDYEKIKESIVSLATPFVDEIWTDKLGNLICHKKGTGAKIMFSAHMDIIGLIVTHIDEKGYIYVSKIGGVRPENILHTKVCFVNGTVGTVSNLVGCNEKLTMDDIFVDIGANSREEAAKKVSVGDIAYYNGEIVETENMIISPYLDDKIGCFILLKAMEQMKNNKNDLYFVFTVQEEVGLHGARTAAFSIAPDYGIAVDVTCTDDIPGSKHNFTTQLGNGAAIKVMDGSVLCHDFVVKKLKEIANEKGIQHQVDIMCVGGTDAGPIHVSRDGVVTGGITIPCRYIHSPNEMVSKSDVEKCIELAVAFSESDL